jgi:hypothetical protein
MIETSTGPLWEKADYTGAWADADEDIQQHAVLLNGSCVARDGNRHTDGSRGSVRMTPNQLLDLFAFILSGEKRK